MVLIYSDISFGNGTAYISKTVNIWVVFLSLETDMLICGRTAYTFQGIIR